MSISPDTLMEESVGERRERQARTGSYGNGVLVQCYPYPDEDPNITHVQHRAVCLTRPYSGCTLCPHSRFSLTFNARPEDKYEPVSCPRWRGETERMQGEAPEMYVTVERALCSEKPFQFCPSCPSNDELVKIGADKVSPGWYGRWRRVTFEEED